MSDARPTAPFFLIIADFDRNIFCVEGPMSNDRAWKDAAMNARNRERRIECGPTGPDRDALAADYHRALKLGGAPPGTILRPRP